MHYPTQGSESGRVVVRMAERLELQAFGAVTLSPTRMNCSAWLVAPYWRLHVYHRPIAIQDARSGMLYKIVPNRLYLLPPWWTFLRECKSGVRHVYLHLAAPWMPRRVVCETWKEPLLLASDRAKVETMWAVAESFLGGGSRIRLTHLMNLMSLAYFCFTEMLMDEQSKRGVEWADGPDIPENLSRTLTIIQRNLSFVPSIPSLAREAGLSTTHFYRLFQKYFHCTPQAYVLEKRIAESSQLLLETELSIDEIAERCGFSQRHYFSRMFKKFTGVPPALYRRSHRH